MCRRNIIPAGDMPRTCRECNLMKCIVHVNNLASYVCVIKCTIETKLSICLEAGVPPMKGLLNQNLVLELMS